MERRIDLRIPLDAPCLLTFVVEGKKPYPAMLIDMNRRGLQLALSPDPAEGLPTVHARGIVTQAPASVAAYLEGATGEIVWIASRHCGIRLDEELRIAPEELVSLTYL